MRIADCCDAAAGSRPRRLGHCLLHVGNHSTGADGRQRLNRSIQRGCVPANSSRLTASPHGMPALYPVHQIRGLMLIIWAEHAGAGFTLRLAAAGAKPPLTHALVITQKALKMEERICRRGRHVSHAIRNAGGASRAGRRTYSCVHYKYTHMHTLCPAPYRLLPSARS